MISFLSVCIAECAVGCLLGYVAASLSESFCHRKFGHADASLCRWIRKSNRFLGWLKVIRFFHATIHHRQTYRNQFTVQFAEDDSRERLLNRVPSKLARKAEITEFGATIHLSSIPFFMAPAGVLLFPLVLWSSLAAFAAFLMLLLPPLLSKHLHPLMHHPYANASQQNGVCGYLLRTKYIRRVIRHHWLHHKYPDFNFNLLLVGDYLLGTHRCPSVTDLKEMKLEGIPID